ncbi:MAG TPA: protein translocase subunit SecF [Armatimonadota bacterium]|nr:protein translocase subunit SecF [Armatimonadota bacterium]
MVELFRGRKWDLVGLRNYWFALSLFIIVIGVYSLVTRGLAFGIDFTAGGQLTYQLGKSLSSQEVAPALAAIRSDVEKLGAHAEIQIAGAAIAPRNQILLHLQTASQQSGEMNAEIQDQARQILDLLQRRYPGVELVSTEMVGPLISHELVINAIMAVTVGLFLVSLWIIIRYDYKFSTCAMVALAHDVLILIGAFSLLGKRIDSPFVAVVLTVVGYSVHDTVVIFDRIRENLKLRKGSTFAETTNISLLETMARSVNTGLPALFAILALYLLGGATLRDFSLALLIGIASGTYSSIFNASQLLVVWKQRDERKRRPAGARPAPVARPAAPAPLAPPPAPAAREQREEPAPWGAGAAGSSSDAAVRGKARPRKKATKRKKRY